MNKTDETIEIVANAFSQLSKPEYKALYVAVLYSIVRMAKSEQIVEMQHDFERCTQMKLLH